MKVIILLVAIINIPNISSARTVNRPLEQKSVEIFYHKNFKEKLELSLVLSCKDNPIASISKCERLNISYKKIFQSLGKSETNLIGDFPREDLNKYINYIIKNYFKTLDYSFTFKYTEIGSFFGYFLLGIPGSILGAIITLSVDLVRLPVTGPYLIASKIHRSVQFKKIKRRLQKLLENKKFKTTRILNIKTFTYSVSRTIDWLTHNYPNQETFKTLRPAADADL